MGPKEEEKKRKPEEQRGVERKDRSRRGQRFVFTVLTSSEPSSGGICDVQGRGRGTHEADPPQNKFQQK